jgi:hypothetical protein
VPVEDVIVQRLVEFFQRKGQLPLTTGIAGPVVTGFQGSGS